MTALWIMTGFAILYYNNYLLLASIAICSATIIPIDPTIGNKSEFSCNVASSIFFTESEIVVTLASMLVLAPSRVEPNPEISDFSVVSLSDVSFKTEFSFMSWFEIPPRFWLRTVVATEP